MKKYAFGLCGPFDFDEKSTGGQSVKTREFYYALCDAIGKNNIKILESTSYKNNPMRFVLELFSLMKDCRNVVLFPAQKGIRVFSPICACLKKPLKTKTYYNVIGGWISSVVDTSFHLKSSLKMFDAILVETNSLKMELKKRGLNNVVQLSNFKRIKPINSNEIKNIGTELHFCYFSRITKEKGIEDAIDVVKKLNSHGIACTLDIYGPVVTEYEEEFKQISKTFDSSIAYKGIIHPSNSIGILKNYDLQLFPTHYLTEGIPGSIIDSYFAGVPVIAARWNSFSDVIDEGITGIGYELNNRAELYSKISDLANNHEKIMTMKRNCLEKAVEYRPENILHKFMDVVNYQGNEYGDKCI